MIEGMKKALFILALLLCPWSALGQAVGAINGYATLGGVKAVTQGASSTNNLEGIIPHATITVYITGTTTKATIYADGSSTKLANPFYANALGATNPGGWVFWTATNAGVDVIGSGGIAPNTYPAPVSLCVDCFPSSQFIAPGVVTIVGANGPITCTGGSCDITGQSTVLQHNGTNLPSQSLLNFLDAAPSLPSGDTPVTFTTNSGGGIGGYVPPVSLGSSLAMGVTPPVSGQYAIVYPTSSSTSNCGSGLIGANNTSGFIDYNYGGSGGCPATITYTFGALPSYILAANVTAVYGFTVASSQPLVASNIAAVSMICGPGSSTIVTSNAIIPINQYTSGGSIMTGAQVSGSICTATANGSVFGAKSVNFDIKSVGLIVYYTGSAPPANTNILVEAPLYFNPSSLTLGITLPFDVGLDTGSTNALAASVAGYNLTLGQRITLAAAHNTSSTTPTFALNGLSALTIVGPTGGALTSGDINTTVPAILMYGTNGSTGLWYLQNPQVSGGGGGVTSINSNAGAFTFSGSGVSCTGTTCTFSGSGSGLTSLNGLTGPALNLTSSDSSVTITPSGSTINLQAIGGGGGGGVQYPASTTAYAIMGDSRAGVTSSCQMSALPSDAAPVTAGSVTSGTASFTGTNTWASGCITTLSGFTGGATGLNGQLCVVSATGLSGSAFQCPVTGGAIGSTGTGQAGTTYNLTGYLGREQYINGHGTVTNYATSSQTLAQANTAYATTGHTKSPAVTSNPGYLILEDWAQDILNGRTVAQIEADYSTLLTTARADSWTGIICTTMPALRASGSPLFVAPYQEWQTVNQWILSMTPTSTNIAAGAYCDRVVQLDDVLANGYDGTYFIQSGSGHLTDNGNRVAADKIVKAISNPSDLVEQNTAADFMLQGPFVAGDGPILGVSDGSGSGSNAAWGWALHQWSGTNVYPVYGFRPTSGSGGPLTPVLSYQGISGGYAHELGTANGYCWGAITPPTAPDTCWTRAAAGEIAAGQGGAAGDGTGGVKLSWLHTTLSTANTGSCASGLGGQWSFGADGTQTRCPTGGGTWTSVGGGSFTAAGDLSGSSSSQEVIGIHSVPLCTGFTPTNSQVLTYTTASSPNPCWTATAGGGGGGSGLFSQIMSATPTLSSTGLTTAWNQAGTFSATNAATGILINDTTATPIGDINEGVLKAYPSTPFTLITLMSNPMFTPDLGAGPWINIVIASSPSGAVETFGMNKNASIYGLCGIRWSNPNTYSAYAFDTSINVTPFIWLKLKDDGTTVTLFMSGDGVAWQFAYSETKSSSFLGSSGYNYLGVGMDTHGAVYGGNTLMSWTITTP